MFRYDESDPELLIVYTGAEHPEMADYRDLVARWQARLEGPTRFGVVMFYEPHEHDEHEERDAAAEAEFSELLNDVRRTSRALINRRCVGYAAVVPPSHHQYSDEELEQQSQHTDRFARYTFGIPGRGFRDLDSAVLWLRQQAEQPPLPLDEAPTTGAAPAAVRTGLFYGSTTGTTEYVAEEIQRAWQEAGLDALPSVNIGDVRDLSELTGYGRLILGIPTWNVGQLQDDWDLRWEQLDRIDFRGVSVALFGIGDQANYPENFLDALGMLAVKLRERGAELFGRCDAAEYEFEASLALEDGALLGLGIDEINQPELTDARVRRWVAQLAEEWALQPAAGIV